MDTNLLQFLQSQKLVAIATIDNNKTPWIANVYYSITPDGKLFFVSSPKTKHSTHLLENNTIAFTVSWFNENDLEDRIAVQGTGTCEKLGDPIKAIEYLKNHYKFFPSWKSVLTNKSVREKILQAKYYLITPKFIKFWNDKLYGEEVTKEFTF